jgi:hypothetical protein
MAKPKSEKPIMSQRRLVLKGCGLLAVGDGDGVGGADGDGRTFVVDWGVDENEDAVVRSRAVNVVAVVNAGTGLRLVEVLPSEYSQVDVDSSAEEVVAVPRAVEVLLVKDSDAEFEVVVGLDEVLLDKYSQVDVDNSAEEVEAILRLVEEVKYSQVNVDGTTEYEVIKAVGVLLVKYSEVDIGSWEKGEKVLVVEIEAGPKIDGVLLCKYAEVDPGAERP